MKLFVFLALACIWCTSSAEDRPEGCKSELFPTFKLKYGEYFVIQEGCFRLTCRGGNLYEMSNICYDLYKGYPADKYKEKVEERGTKMLNGGTCQSNL